MSQQALIETWRAREALYRELFGPHKFNLPRRYAPPEFSLPQIRTARDIACALGKTISEKRDISVLAFEPNELRPYWMYATSGLSNPWFGSEDGEVSGFGCELVLKSHDRAIWPVKLLRRLVSYVLTYSGSLSPGVMLTLDLPLSTGAESRLDSVLIWYLDEAVDCIYMLPSGQFGIFLVVGITTEEREFVRSSPDFGCWCMQQLLRNCGLGQITDPRRPSVMSREDVRSTIFSLLSYAQNFGVS